MLVEHHQPVETNGKSGRQGEADGDRRDHDRGRRDAGAVVAQLDPAQVATSPAGHDERDEPQQEGDRHGVRSVQKPDPLRACRDFDRRGQRQERQEPEQERNPGSGSTA